jgi:hypothetical protein
MIEPGTRIHQFEVSGSTRLLFNDKTQATLHETFEHVKRTRGASKCFFVVRSVKFLEAWSQLVFEDSEVCQYSFHGATKRLVTRKPNPTILSDDDIHAMIRPPAHSSTSLRTQ